MTLPVSNVTASSSSDEAVHGDAFVDWLVEHQQAKMLR